MSDKLADWITEEIEIRGWSLRELGRRADLSHATISNVVSGQTKPGLDFCTGIAKAFNVPAETVLRRAGLLSSREESAPDLRELNFLYSQLAPEDREQILRMMRGYVNEARAYGKK
jgi:transcriptional regulator with XRE-family HTH domain